MPRAGDIEDLEAAGADEPVEVGVDEVQPRGRAPVAQKPRLDVGERQRLAQQRFVEQVDLADREVVGRAPIGMQGVQIGIGERRIVHKRRGGNHGGHTRQRGWDSSS